MDKKGQNTERRSGVSTRIIDNAVQDFFEKQYCVLSDHAPYRPAQMRTIGIFSDRLAHEHKILRMDLEVWEILRASDLIGYAIKHRQAHWVDLSDIVMNQIKEDKPLSYSKYRMRKISGDGKRVISPRDEEGMIPEFK